MPPLSIPRSPERPRADAYCLPISRAPLTGDSFAVRFLSFDLLQIHCEVNHFAKRMFRINELLLIERCIEAAAAVPVIALDSPGVWCAACFDGFNILHVNIT